MKFKILSSLFLYILLPFYTQAHMAIKFPADYVNKETLDKYHRSAILFWQDKVIESGVVGEEFDIKTLKELNMKAGTIWESILKLNCSAELVVLFYESQTEPACENIRQDMRRLYQNFVAFLESNITIDFKRNTHNKESQKLILHPLIQEFISQIFNVTLPLMFKQFTGNSVELSVFNSLQLIYSKAELVFSQNRSLYSTSDKAQSIQSDDLSHTKGDQQVLYNLYRIYYYNLVFYQLGLVETANDALECDDFGVLSPWNYLNIHWMQQTNLTYSLYGEQIQGLLSGIRNKSYKCREIKSNEFNVIILNSKSTLYTRLSIANYMSIFKDPLKQNQDHLYRKYLSWIQSIVQSTNSYPFEYH